MREYIEIMELVEVDGERLSLTYSSTAFSKYADHAQRYVICMVDGDEHVYGVLDWYWVADGVMHSVYGHLCSLSEWEDPSV